jgi:error-prone DNA polymerase
MGHKRSRQKMEALSLRLIEGMVKNGIEEEAAWRIYHQLSAFADFGFAESHAASFALLVYVSAWLKVYYPAVFYCSLLNSQPMGFYTPATVVYEARRRGTEILNIDASRSLWECTIEGDRMRLGFKYIKQLGDAAKDILEERLKTKPLRTIKDWALFSGLNQRGLEQLAAAGAFDCFGKPRRDALWEILALKRQHPEELPLSWAADVSSAPCANPRRSGSEGASRPRNPTSLPVSGSVMDKKSRDDSQRPEPTLPPMTTTEQLAADFRTKDLSTGPHPMSLVRDRLKKAGILASTDLKAIPNNRVVNVAGVVTIRQRPMTAKGFMFITLEDETGFSNIVVKPQMLERFRKEIVFHSGLIVKGLLEKKDGVINVIGHHFEPLEIDDKDINIRSRDFR